MNIRDLLERYKNGTATEEEIRKVEEELENNHLGMDEDDFPIRFEQEDYNEVKLIKKEVRKKKATIILTSVAVMLTIFLGFKFILTPMLNGFYYNPEQYNYAAHYNDLSVKLATFTELHFPNKISKGVNVSHNGIGSYTFSFYQQDMFKEKVDTISGEIKRSSISLDDEFWQYVSIEHFPSATYPISSTLTTDQINNIEKLPSYSYIKAYISFEKDKNMEELAQMIDENANLELYISWVGIRNSKETVQNVPLIGFEPSGVGPFFEKMTEEYPYYELSNHTHSSSKLSGEVFEKHFLDLIQFQLDHDFFIEMMGRDTLPRGYYESVLEYVAHNGIHSYGLVVQGYPSAILTLANQLDISHISVDEIKMALPKE